MSRLVEPLYDPRLLQATLPGSLVWERSPFEEPGLNDRPLRGGTVVEFNHKTHLVTFIASTPMIRSKKSQVIHVNTGELPLAELDPATVVNRDDRPYDRVKIARKLLRAVGESTSQSHTGWDERLVGWATLLWEPYSRTPLEDDCRSGACRLFGPPCRRCDDEAFVVGHQVEELLADSEALL